MYVKKRHLEMLRYLEKGGKELEKEFPEEFKARELELFIMGLVENGKITPQGQVLLDITKEINLEEFPELFMDTSIAYMLEEYDKSGYLLRTWEEPLKERKFIDENGITEVGKNALEFARTYQPNLYISPEMIGLIYGLPPVGSEAKLRKYAYDAYGSDNVVNAMEAVKLVLISPPNEEGEKAYAFTKAVEYIKKTIPKDLEKPIILSVREMDALYGDTSQESDYYKEGEITTKGMEALTLYEFLVQKVDRIAPSYVSEKELEVLKTIRRIEEINKHTPDIIPTYSEIRERGGFEKLKNILYLLETKDLVKFDRETESWWLTPLGHVALEYGGFTIEASRSLTMPESNQVPAYQWYKKATEEELIKEGYITGKGKFALKVSRMRKEKPLYLTKYDAWLLSSIPRKRFLRWDELVEKLPPDYEREFIGEAESKNFVEVLHNNTVGLTELGEEIKLAIEKAKLDDIKATEFPITPNFYAILKYFYHNHNKLVNLWKERGYSRMVVQIIKDTKFLPDEVKKALVVLRNLGFIGKLGLTESGKRIVEAMERFYNQ